MSIAAPRASRSIVDPRSALGLTVLLAAVVVAGACVVIAPLLAVLPIVLVIAAASISSGMVRLALLSVGALIVFQSATASSAPRYLYAVVLVWVIALSAVDILRTRDRVPTVIVAGAFLAVLVAGTALVAGQRGTTGTLWARDFITYGLVLVAPLVGYAAARRMGRSPLGLTLVVGIVSSLGFAVDWLSRRGVSSLPFDRFVYGSGALASLAMAILVAAACRRQHTALALFGAAVVAASQLVTGTRTSLIYFAAPLAIAIYQVWRERSWRGFRILVGLGAIAALSLPLLASRLTDDPRFLSQRFELGLGALGGSLQGDQSFQLRSIAYGLARTSFEQHPWFGTGLGYEFATQDLKYASGLTLDTPLVTVAKFGIVGSAALAIFLIAWVAFLWKLSANDSLLRYVIVGFVAIQVCFLPFGSPLEDKGFGVAAMLLTAIVAFQARASGRDAGASAASAEGSPASRNGSPSA